MMRRAIEATVVAIAVVMGNAASAMPPAQAFGAVVRVGDILPSCPERICDVAVVPAPLPGRTRVVSRQDVVSAIEKAGFESTGLRIPPRRRVTRPARQVPESVLRERILKAVAAVLPPGVALEELGHLREVTVPRSGFEAEARWPGPPQFMRRASIPVDLISEGERFLTIQVSALLVMEAEVPVARRDLQAGVVITEQDVVYESVRLETGAAHLAAALGEVVGRQTARFIEKGDPFEQRALARIPVVRKGGQLTVESVFGLVKVKTTGVSRQDGAVGDRVRVVLVPVNRLVWAEIVAPGRAVVMP